MSCHGCAEKYGFLKKEYGCPKCGFSFCKKCLRFQIMDPKTSKQLQVCTRCHQSVSAPREPMAILSALHRLESMDDPAKPPITLYKQPVRQKGLQELKQGLCKEDQHILERLVSLKKDDSEGDLKNSGRRSSENMEDEIAERLARLKGEEYRPETKSQRVAFLKNVKPETEQDVIAKFAAEVDMDSKYQASVTSDIEERLARLRGETNPAERNVPGTSTGVNEDQDELTEEDQVKLIMKKLQEELALDQKLGDDGIQATDMDVDSPGNTHEIDPIESDEDIDVDELCGICSEKRATLICKECDDDIYCKVCFQELHRDLGEVHAPKVFKKK